MKLSAESDFLVLLVAMVEFQVADGEVGVTEVFEVVITVTVISFFVILLIPNLSRCYVVTWLYWWWW